MSLSDMIRDDDWADADREAQSAKDCDTCDGTGEVRDEENADAEVVDDPPRTVDRTPMIECPDCNGTGEVDE